MKALGPLAAATIAFVPISLVVATTPVVAQAVAYSSSAADEEKNPPWWQWGLHYGVFMTTVGLIAWVIGLISHRSSPAPRVPAGPVPRRAVWVGPAFPTTAQGNPEVKRRVLVEAAHRCAVPTCRNPTTEIAHIVSETQRRDDSFDNLIALCPSCQGKGIARQSIRTYKRNLGILNSRYSDLERRLFDQIAESGRKSFVVEAGLEIPLLRAVNDGLLKRVDSSPASTHHKYEVADAGLDFVSRYARGEDLS
ncbi:HNH endonuclease signature motif containing protein [Mycobacterium sp. pR1184]|uniref:HNH endonuclease signature motif containing protein n=1 Tax=Mycobacterium sp. pR1184 TaxID=3238981 RepID=UPI00351AB9C6